MNIVLNRQAGVAVKEQLITQIEMQILGGELAAGQKLPSVRALAVASGFTPTRSPRPTASLEAAGRVRLKRGSGVYVEERGIERLEEAKGLDEMVRLALHKAFRAGTRVARSGQPSSVGWAVNPPQRIVVVEPDPPSPS